ncbi:hypothetical protein ACX12L_03135 [Alicycliphilus sp. T452]
MRACIRGLAVSKESPRGVYEDRMAPVRTLSQIVRFMPRALARGPFQCAGGAGAGRHPDAALRRRPAFEQIGARAVARLRLRVPVFQHCMTETSLECHGHDC